MNRGRATRRLIAAGAALAELAPYILGGLAAGLVLAGPIVLAAMTGWGT